MVNERYCDIAGLTNSNWAHRHEWSPNLRRAILPASKTYYERAFNGEAIEAEVLSRELTSILAFISVLLSPH